MHEVREEAKAPEEAPAPSQAHEQGQGQEQGAMGVQLAAWAAQQVQHKAQDDTAAGDSVPQPILQEASQQFEELTVSQPMCPEAPFAHAVAADAAAQQAAQFTPDEPQLPPLESESESASEAPSSSAASTSDTSDTSDTRDTSDGQASAAPQPPPSPSIRTWGLTQQQVSEAQAVVDALIPAVVLGGSDSAEMVGSNLGRWSAMVVASPDRATVAVLEMRAVAEAVAEAVGDPCGAARPVEVTAATEDAAAGRARSRQGAWTWAWACETADTAPLLHPFQALLSISDATIAAMSKTMKVGGMCVLLWAKGRAAMSLTFRQPLTCLAYRHRYTSWTQTQADLPLHRRSSLNHAPAAWHSLWSLLRRCHSWWLPPSGLQLRTGATPWPVCWKRLQATTPL